MTWPFCNLNASAALGPKFNESVTSTSCQCLCELTEPESKEVNVTVANFFNAGDQEYELAQAGEGIQMMSFYSTIAIRLEGTNPS